MQKAFLWCLSREGDDGEEYYSTCFIFILMVSIPGVQAGDRHLEQAVEEGSRTAPGGRRSASGLATLRFLHALWCRVSFQIFSARLDLRRGFRYLVNAKSERGTLRELLRSGVQLDLIGMVRTLSHIGQDVYL